MSQFLGRLLLFSFVEFKTIKGTEKCFLVYIWLNESCNRTQYLLEYLQFPDEFREGHVGKRV